VFRAVKHLNLTFLAVQALLKEPPDLLQGKAVLKGEKNLVLSEKLQALVLDPTSGNGREDRREQSPYGGK
jgi:hypothetical protein